MTEPSPKKTAEQPKIVPSRTAKYKGKWVAIIRYSTKNCRVCPLADFEKLSLSEECWSSTAELVPTAELLELTEPKKIKKKKAAKKAS